MTSAAAGAATVLVSPSPSEKSRVPWGSAGDKRSEQRSLATRGIPMRPLIASAARSVSATSRRRRTGRGRDARPVRGLDLQPVEGRSLVHVLGPKTRDRSRHVNLLAFETRGPGAPAPRNADER